MLRNGVMPIPPARNTAARVKLSGRVKSPDGPSIFTVVPSGIVFNTRLNAVSRIRVATIRVSSLGPLAIEKLRTLPSESVSGGASKVMSRYWPALNAQLAGLSKRKAIVTSATSCRLKSLAEVGGGVGVVVIVLLLFLGGPRVDPEYMQPGAGAPLSGIHATNLANNIPASWLKYW